LKLGKANNINTKVGQRAVSRLPVIEGVFVLMATAVQRFGD